MAVSVGTFTVILENYSKLINLMPLFLFDFDIGKSESMNPV